MEHLEWCPPGYRDEGLFGQRIAVAGHSHWSDELDHEDATRACLGNVISGKWRIAFFTSVARYFGFDEPTSFWPQVLFFNFLPTMVGGSSERFGYGTSEQLERGRTRVLRIFDEHAPQKLFVFSLKAWKEFPPSIEDTAKIEAQAPLYWHSYQLPGGQRLRAVGLRHPQGADRRAMSTTVYRLVSDVD